MKQFLSIEKARDHGKKEKVEDFSIIKQKQGYFEIVDTGDASPDNIIEIWHQNVSGNGVKRWKRMYPAGKIRLDFKLDPKIKEMLAKICEWENRNMTDEIIYLIKQEYEALTR